MENKEGIQKIVSVLCSVFSIEKKNEKSKYTKNLYWYMSDEDKQKIRVWKKYRQKYVLGRQTKKEYMKKYLKE